ncbi:MAG: methyltransferase domain-containing protein [Solobacterium sp.]|nr:methyltransferase domain-containing protein [Solobacterium sp.]
MKLICPNCGKPLSRTGRSAVCENRHCFDYAKSGYLNLLGPQKKDPGDNAEMVKARTAFLSTGAYAFLRETIRQMLESEPVQVFADLGCGEGYYTSACPGEEKYGFDLSRPAVNYAAKHDPSASYVIASIFHLPLPDESCDAAMTCFAPAAADEIHRILKPGGRFVFVQPAEDHLFELKQVLYDTPYQNTVTPPALPLKEESCTMIRNTFTADRTALHALFQMTPYAYHTSTDGIERLNRIGSLQITASFAVRLYRRESN